VRRRVLVVASVLALVWPAAASAHVTVSPTRIAPSEEATLVFHVPDEHAGAARLTSLTLRLPGTLRIESVEAKAGWTAQRRGWTITWRGGMLRVGEFVDFAVVADAPPRPAVLHSVAVEGFSDGQAEHYPVPITVREATPTRARDAGARTLGKAALIVAIVAAAAAAGAFFIATAVWLRA
jgi:uncharacterized protein YcnI